MNRYNSIRECEFAEVEAKASKFIYNRGQKWKVIF